MIRTNEQLFSVSTVNLEPYQRVYPFKGATRFLPDDVEAALTKAANPETSERDSYVTLLRAPLAFSGINGMLVARSIPKLGGYETPMGKVRSISYDLDGRSHVSETGISLRFKFHPESLRAYRFLKTYRALIHLNQDTYYFYCKGASPLEDVENDLDYKGYATVEDVDLKTRDQANVEHIRRVALPQELGILANIGLELVPWRRNSRDISVVPPQESPNRLLVAV